MSYVSPAHSKLLYGAQPHVLANGVQQGIVKIRLRDDHDQPVAGRQVELIADRANVAIEQPGLTDANGTALAYVTSTVPGPVNISGRVVPVTPT
jgi:hypothetical protein